MNTSERQSTLRSSLVLIIVNLISPLLATLPAAADSPEALVEAPITDGDRAHWAFQPIVKASPPAVTDRDWPRTPVDAFVLARLEKKGLTPASIADRATLLRRLTFDLTGLPPTPEELSAFEADRAPDAWDRQVDRLLASPAYGERWGQHWLDLARFAETDGFEHDRVRPEAWRYRDWTIAALNQDMPYDRFLLLQLAGDEVMHEKESESDATGSLDAEILNFPVATTFCLAGPDMPDVNDQEERRHYLLNDVTATVGSALLGLQMGCAQCHDHKYDPLSQGDFFRLRAFFEPAVALTRNLSVSQLSTSQEKAAPARFWIRGDHRRPGPELAPAFPRIAAADGEKPAISDQAKLRTELARWLVSDHHPLTSRVMANRVWQHHFGRGICDTPSDFGLMSAAPTHPELLDWLAVKLREQGWSLKHLHRVILGSATYRQAGRLQSEVSPSLTLRVSDWKRRLELDPDNQLYSRFPRRRLEGEAIRDSLLAVAGMLTTERGGPGVMPPLPPELIRTLLNGQWRASEREADHFKRSVYIFARRNLRYPIFEAFDRPDANASCPARSRSTIAPQALVMFNAEFTLNTAQHLAGRIAKKTSDPAEQIGLLYRLALGRLPQASELATMQAFLAGQREQLVAEGREAASLAMPLPGPVEGDPYAAAALVDACLAVLNTSEFIYLD